jgi:hypothetical protein
LIFECPNTASSVTRSMPKSAARVDPCVPQIVEAEWRHLAIPDYAIMSIIDLGPWVSEMDLDREIALRGSAGRPSPGGSGRPATRASFLVELSPGTKRRMKIAQSDKVATLALLSLAMRARSTSLTGDELNRRTRPG